MEYDLLKERQGKYNSFHKQRKLLCIYRLILQEFYFNDGIIKVSAVSYNTFITENKYIFIGKNGEILKEQTGEYAEYKMNGTELYVRVQVVSEHGAMLWTQPIYDGDRFQ